MKNLILKKVSLAFVLFIATGCCTLNSSHYQRRECAISKTSDEHLLTQVALNRNELANIRFQAARKLGKDEIYRQILSNPRDDEDLRMSLIQLTSDETTISHVALDRFSDAEIRIAALKRLSGATKKTVGNKILTDDIATVELLEAAISAVENPQEIVAAVNRMPTATIKGLIALLPKSVIDLLAASADDRVVQIAASVLSNKYSWNDIVRDSDKWGTGNILGAISLTNDHTAPEAEVVRGLCHQHIRAGNEDRIPELKEFLSQYGDINLAEDYLNCGNSVLYNAGAEWGRDHGYNIGTGPGSARVHWGSDRQ